MSKSNLAYFGLINLLLRDPSRIDSYVLDSPEEFLSSRGTLLSRLKDINNHSSNLYKIGVYVIEHIPSGKIYIGSTGAKRGFKNRFKIHECYLKNGNHVNKKLQEHWNLDGPTSFVFSILDICDSSEECLDIEQGWVNLLIYKDYDFNVRLNTHNTLEGYKHPEDVRKRINERHKGNKYSLGLKRSEETKRRMSESAKRREALKRENRE